MGQSQEFHQHFQIPFITSANNKLSYRIPLGNLGILEILPRFCDLFENASILSLSNQKNLSHNIKVIGRKFVKYEEHQLTKMINVR
jgi:hypothetical protein